MKENKFEVLGAGEIVLGDSPNGITGEDTIGFHFGVTWGRHGEIGGILSRQEAKRLADFINEQLGRKDLKTYKEVLRQSLKEN